MTHNTVPASLPSLYMTKNYSNYSKKTIEPPATVSYFLLSYSTKNLTEKNP